MTVLFLGLVCWWATTIIVESEITRPLREWCERHMHEKVAYLAHCHMCCGTWVGLALAAVFGGPFPGFAGWVANGLLYKAIGHLVLELRPQAWYVEDEPEIAFKTYGDAMQGHSIHQWILDELMPKPTKAPE